MDDLYLYHHGIKGMKWGVRRFQNKDGSYTNAGKRRRKFADTKFGSKYKLHDDPEKELREVEGSSAGKKRSQSGNAKSINAKTTNKSQHRLLLENKYRKEGYSKEEAVAAAERRIKIEKAVAITAGVTVVAATAYVARNKYLADHCDQILKAGTQFHNLDRSANPRPGEHLYVNYRKNDVNYFRGHFAINKMRTSETGKAFNHVVTAKEDVKIPSLKTRQSTFKQLFDNDPEFRAAFNKHSRSGEGNMSSKKVYKKMWQKFGDKDDPEFNVAKRKYFDALRKKGYEAIVDEWDTSPGVFRSDAPLILLNTSSKSLGEMTIKELSAREVLLAQANSRNYQPSRSLLTALGVPHTNRFRESERHKSRYEAKSSRNKQYIDKALSERAKLGGLFDNEDADRGLAISRKGSVIADTGKYLTKHKNMTYQQAYQKATRKKAATDTAVAALMGSIGAVPYTAYVYAANRAYVSTYIKEHPNTNLTYNEILKTKHY